MVFVALNVHGELKTMDKGNQSGRPVAQEKELSAQGTVSASVSVLGTVSQQRAQGSKVRGDPEGGHHGQRKGIGIIPTRPLRNRFEKYPFMKIMTYQNDSRGKKQIYKHYLAISDQIHNYE